MVPASLFVAYKVIPKGKSFFQRVSHVVHMLQMEIPQNSDKHSFGCQVIANMRVSPTDCVMRKSPPFDSPFHPMGGIMSRAAQYSRVRTGSALRHARGCGSATNRTAQESHPIEHGVVHGSVHLAAGANFSHRRKIEVFCSACILGNSPFTARRLAPKGPRTALSETGNPPRTEKRFSGTSPSSLPGTPGPDRWSPKSPVAGGSDPPG